METNPQKHVVQKFSVWKPEEGVEREGEEENPDDPAQWNAHSQVGLRVIKLKREVENSKTENGRQLHTLTTT